MRCSRCVLPVLALYLMLDDTSAFLLPDRLRQKREVGWLDQEFSPHLPGLSHPADLSPGDADGETVAVRGDREGRHSQAASHHVSLERLSTQQHHGQPRRKTSDKWRKVTPLDPIGGFLLSNQRGIKDAPGDMEYME